MGHQHLTAVTLNHLHFPILRHYEGLVVGAILFRFCGHESHVTRGTYLGCVQLAIGLAVLDDDIVDPGIAPVWYDELCITQGVLLGPHAPGIAHCGSHGSVHNDVRWNVQVGDATATVHVGQGRPFLVAGHEILFHLRLLWVSLDLHIDITHTVIGIDPELLEERGVFFEGVFVEDLYAMPEEHRVRHFHHGRLEMQREQSSWFCRVHLLLIELSQLCYSHHATVNDFS
mmetsp:Transcript_37967/g.81623  ORF Transcript_37967/g.81623 Transcript_37967/m.81623 type:complete len:229 (-) Transcript_37967:1084-1770(-)